MKESSDSDCSSSDDSMNEASDNENDSISAAPNKHLQHVSDSISKADSNVIGSKRKSKPRAMESGSQIKKSRAASSSSSPRLIEHSSSLLSGFEDGAFPIRMRNSLGVSHIPPSRTHILRENARTFVAFTEIMLPPMLGIYGALVKTGARQSCLSSLEKMIKFLPANELRTLMKSGTTLLQFSEFVCHHQLSL